MKSKESGAHPGILFGVAANFLGPHHCIAVCRFVDSLKAREKNMSKAMGIQTSLEIRVRGTFGVPVSDGLGSHPLLKGIHSDGWQNVDRSS